MTSQEQRDKAIEQRRDDLKIKLKPTVHNLMHPNGKLVKSIISVMVSESLFDEMTDNLEKRDSIIEMVTKHAIYRAAGDDVAIMFIDKSSLGEPKPRSIICEMGNKSA